jgi:hypothetical protein
MGANDDLAAVYILRPRNTNIEMKWWPRHDGTSRHIWVSSAGRDVWFDPGVCDEAECIATSPGICPCGKVEWVGVA